ncbi:MAG: hypothetical protein DHS20C18_20040 [Saprospiraceae bacterium]|nr:MAG: hypothetical protein DHS20C18_20040 [Saprospiraceae bacterium]
MLKKQYLKDKPACKVTFSLPKEVVNGAKEVKVLGDFNNWSWENGVNMKASKTAYTAVVELKAGSNYEFRYLIDNQKWENDWEADAYQINPFGVENSVISLEAKAVAKKATTAKKTAKAVTKTASKATTTKKVTAKKATTKTTAKKTTAKKAAVVDQTDLKKIEGIGPKIAEMLNAKGIKTFADLAKAKNTDLQAILDAAGPRYKMHNPSTWSEQAKLAAKGNWDKLTKLQNELKGGKR